MRRLTALLALLGVLGCDELTVPVVKPILIVPAWTAPARAALGRQLADTPAVRVTRSDGSPVSGVEVVFARTLRAGAPLNPVVVLSDSTGLATMPGGWTLSPQFGPQELVASVVASGGPSLTFTVEGEAGPAAVVTLSTTATGLLAIGDSVEVTASADDGFGNPPNPTVPIELAPSDEAMLEVRNGWVIAKAPGWASVVARAGVASARAPIGVRPASVPLPLVTVDTLPFARVLSAFLSGSRLLYGVSTESGQLMRLDLSVGQLLSPFTDLRRGFDIAVLSPRDEIWVGYQGQSRVLVLGASDGVVRRSQPLAGEVLRMLPIPSGGGMFVSTSSSRDGHVYRLDATTMDGPRATIGALPNGFALSPDSTTVLVSSVNAASVYLLDANDLTRLRSVLVGGRPQEVIVNSVTGIAYVLNETGANRVFDARTLAPSAYVPPANGAFGGALTADGRYIVVAALSDGVRILDAITLESVWSMPASRPRRVLRDPVTGDMLVVQESAPTVLRLRVTSP